MNKSIRAVVTAVGLIMGLGGVEHGIGEILQGNVAPGGLMIQSWPASEFFAILQGEPAMTIIPNLLVTGVLAVLTSLAYLACLTAYIQRRWAPSAMMLLSVAMLLLGAGMFPPVFTFLTGLLATRINAPLESWRKHVPAGVRAALGNLLGVSLVGCAASWLFLLLGIPAANYYFGVDNTGFMLGVIASALVFLVLAVVTAFAQDSREPINLGRQA